MRIPRFQLFEVEDQKWFPSTIRDLATDYLRFIEKKFALHKAVIPLLAEALRASGCKNVVDLCSGGGGAIPEIQEDLAREGLDVPFTLTDQYPNLAAFEKLSSWKEGRIKYITRAVDAKRLPGGLDGFRTMFNAFHHFKPSDAEAVLRDATQASAPVAVFEIPRRALENLLPMFFLTPFMVLAATPFIRPFSWRRLLWTYLVPLVPLTCWCDGIMSQLRAYTPEELMKMAQAVAAESYQWKAGTVPIGSTPGQMTYLIGIPTSSVSAARCSEIALDSRGPGE